MTTITFVTGNARKLGEAKASCDLFKITVNQKVLAITEIQHHDPVVIAKEKAQAAFAILKQPVVINDSAWSIPALGGFPGGYMHDIVTWFQPQDFLALMAGKADRRTVITETIIYQSATQQKVFSRNFIGSFSDIPRGQGNSIEQVAIFNGLTLAEHHDQKQFAIGPEDQLWYDFAQWLSLQPDA